MDNGLFCSVCLPWNLEVSFLRKYINPDIIFDTRLNCHLFHYAVAFSLIKKGEFQWEELQNVAHFRHKAKSFFSGQYYTCIFGCSENSQGCVLEDWGLMWRVSRRLAIGASLQSTSGALRMRHSFLYWQPVCWAGGRMYSKDRFANHTSQLGHFWKSWV